MAARDEGERENNGERNEVEGKKIVGSVTGREGGPRCQENGAAADGLQTKEKKKILANWVCSRGMYVTDSFIDSLLQSKFPKELTEKVRVANYHTKTGFGTRSNVKHKSTSKYPPPYESVSEWTVAQSFPGAVKRETFIRVAKHVIEKRFNFTDKLTFSAKCHCPLQEPIRIFDVSAFGRSFSLGSIGGILHKRNAVLESLADRCAQSGIKLLLSFEVHACVNSNGQFDDIEVADPQTDVRMVVRPAYVSAVTALHLLGPDQYASKYLSDNDDPDLWHLRKLVHENAERLATTTVKPIREFVDCLYEHTRDRLKTVTDSLNCAVLCLGMISIDTPPGVANYVQLRDVYLHRPDAGLVDKVDSLQGSIARALRKVLAAEEAQRAVKEAKEKLMDEKRRKRRNKLHTEVMEKQREDDWRLDRDTAQGGNEAALKVSKLFLHQRWRRLMGKLLDAMRSHKIHDDWNLDNEDGGKAKVTKLFLYMRWSRIMHKLLERNDRREKRENLRFY